MAQRHDRSEDDEPETCDSCGLVLEVAHEQPAGYTAETPDGGEICGACNDIARDWPRPDGRLTADELESAEAA